MTRVLLFGIYDPAYPRNRVVRRALSALGASVIECNERSRGLLKYVRLLWRFMRVRAPWDVVYVAFPGQEVMPLVRLLTRKPIIFDAFTSHFGGHILDRQTYSVHSIRARYYRWIDRLSCRYANRVLLDTSAHRDFFIRELGVPAEKIAVLPVGTDTAVFYPRPARVGAGCVVHFHGTFIPLQGIDTILRAAALLQGEPITFRIVGRGQTYLAMRRLADELHLHSVEFLPPVPYEQLAEYVADADICLGIFGTTQKAGIVIPNKVYEALASRRALITADTPAIHELLSGANAALIPPGDFVALAEKIRRLAADSDERERLADAGYEAFRRHSGPERISAVLRGVLSDIA